jgi:hypothetical protein
MTSDFPAPPTFFAAFKNGFNAVASHIYVILFPIILDLFLLFGPQLRIGKLLTPLYNELVSQSANIQQLPAADQAQFFTALKEYIARINLLSVISTFPIGIPTIMAPGVIENPLGVPYEVFLGSALSSFFLIILLYLIGVALGVVYFHLLATLGSENKQPSTVKTFFWQYFQVLTFCLWFLAMIFIIIFPVLFVINLIQLLSPIVSQILFFGFLFLILWLGFPLIFTPHGVFAYHQNVLAAAFTSYRLVRSALPSAGLFMSMIILLYLVSLELWVIPPDNSWLILAGIIGHAFLFSGLFVSTLYYYRGSINWMREIIKRNTRPTSIVNQ